MQEKKPLSPILFIKTNIAHISRKERWENEYMLKCDQVEEAK